MATKEKAFDPCREYRHVAADLRKHGGKKSPGAVEWLARLRVRLIELGRECGEQERASDGS